LSAPANYSDRETILGVFKFLLVLDDGSPVDPAAFLTVFLTGPSGRS
jgi:hypothetical protein